MLRKGEYFERPELVSGRLGKQTMSFREIGLPGAYFHPCAEEPRSVCGSLRTVVIQHRGVQCQFSLPAVHMVKVEAEIPEGFLSRKIGE